MCTPALLGEWSVMYKSYRINKIHIEIRCRSTPRFNYGSNANTSSSLRGGDIYVCATTRSGPIVDKFIPITPGVTANWQSAVVQNSTAAGQMCAAIAKGSKSVHVRKDWQFNKQKPIRVSFTPSTLQSNIKKDIWSSAYGAINPNGVSTVGNQFCWRKAGFVPFLFGPEFQVSATPAANGQQLQDTTVGAASASFPQMYDVAHAGLCVAMMPGSCWSGTGTPAAAALCLPQLELDVSFDVEFIRNSGGVVNVDNIPAVDYNEFGLIPTSAIRN